MENTSEALEFMPEEILRHVSRFLHYRDIRRLAMTCIRMKKILPEFKEVKGPDINEKGPSDGDWCPTWYFDTPRLTSSVHRLKISMSWKDQV